MESDTYLTIKSFSQGIYKEKGSRFIAFAFPVSTRKRSKPLLKRSEKNIMMQGTTALPICWGRTELHCRVNDDGEPSGTAGKPILGQINSYRTYQYSDCGSQIFRRKTSWCQRIDKCLQVSRRISNRNA